MGNTVRKITKEFNMIEFGMTVKDKITGNKGIVCARTEYYTGCTHIGFVSTEVKDKTELPEYMWTDEVRLEVMKNKKIDLLGNGKATGGPFENAPSV